MARDNSKWDSKYNQGIPAGPNDKSSGAVIAVLAILGGFSLIAVLGILAAVSLPAYLDYTVRAKLAPSVTSATAITREVEDYATQHQEWPADIHALNNRPHIDQAMVSSIVIEDGTIYVTPSENTGVEGSIIYVPSLSDNGIQWSCKASTIAPRYLPQACRH